MEPHAHILVIEDDADIRESLSELLEAEGYPVVTACHGAHALEQLRAGGPLPCVILLDLMMPVMDGATFRRAQQEDAALAPIPVILVTANNESARHARELGVDGFLAKPFQPEAMLKTVGRYCTAPL